MAFAVYGQAARGHDLDASARTLAAQNATLKQHISDDRNELAQSENPAWLEQQARRLGYVMPNERVFVLVTPGATPPPAGGGVDAKLPSFTAPPTPTPSPGASSPSPSAAATPQSITLPPPHR